MDDDQKQILVVDDDDLLRGFYARLLKKEGFSVIQAVDGDEAVKLLENGEISIDLAIVDLLMPVRTGWELISYMKSSDSTKNIPIIAITGLAESYNEYNKIEETCDALLQKGDFEIGNFMKTLDKLLKKKTE